MKQGKCLKCGSAEIEKLSISSDSEGSRFQLRQRIAKPLFLGPRYDVYPMYSLACMQCGYVEFYMEGFEIDDHDEWRLPEQPES